MNTNSSRIKILAGFGVALFGCLIAVSNLIAAPPEQAAWVPAAASLVPGVSDGGEAEYIGSNKCKKCHLKTHKSWAKTKMGTGFDSLKPGEDAEAKTKHGLDPNKDYTKDESCLKCHVTGYGHAGGYAIPPEGDKKAARKAKHLAGVGCESCHGPGSAYIKLHEEIFKAKRPYKVEEMYAAGMWKVDASRCTPCHNENSTGYDPANPFDFEKSKDADKHDTVEMKYREG